MKVSELELVRLRRECPAGLMAMPLCYYQYCWGLALERELSTEETTDALQRLNDWALREHALDPGPKIGDIVRSTEPWKWRTGE